ncbi:hypothetical protein BCU85_21000 [Vibrio lentus]|uniref:Uncharacterized protein n=1 Tax=Vibrio lentus TaxID=136468 RepID=A0A2N7INL8_9VIBR|nr:hypothetical protein [Vibrio lentus]MCC4819291.1 hypothetical protein [Vibrio lentus]MDN3628771.1 hypothetical protein [Vibrio lentus]PMG72067.1 hypothetical protein BCU85_21000 [Vibrio lentus]PMH32331.1 hypothetical protein BCU71_01905 [Vibrio lentus]PMH95549.1 hypothetical protein BCU54_14520 [Vibrio lentus]
MTSIPTHLQDAKTLLSENGFATGDTWYHGTSSALLASIQGQGLKRSGDKALNEAASKTMATIGNNYTESVEPVFLTQSKELAYYWAQQTIRERSTRFEGEERPIVLAVNLSEKQQAKVRPDVGAMSLLMMSVGEQFMAHLTEIYQENNIAGPDIELRTADRMDYLNKLGMAYIDEDISRACVQELYEPELSEPELTS